jgi:hypothetical protein
MRFLLRRRGSPTLKGASLTKRAVVASQCKLPRFTRESNCRNALSSRPSIVPLSCGWGKQDEECKPIDDG